MKTLILADGVDALVHRLHPSNKIINEPPMPVHHKPTIPCPPLVLTHELGERAPHSGQAIQGRQGLKAARLEKSTRLDGWTGPDPAISWPLRGSPSALSRADSASATPAAWPSGERHRFPCAAASAHP